jgi:hypothetical protein
MNYIAIRLETFRYEFSAILYFRNALCALRPELFKTHRNLTLTWLWFAFQIEDKGGDLFNEMARAGGR